MTKKVNIDEDPLPSLYTTILLSMEGEASPWSHDNAQTSAVGVTSGNEILRQRLPENHGAVARGAGLGYPLQ